MGALGLAAGFLGPPWLNPDADLGPLIGIYFTGPIGLVLGIVVGVILGFVAQFFAWKRSTFMAAIGLSSVAILVLTLSLALPKDRWEADLIEGQIVACSPPISFEPQVLRHWEDSIAINPQNPVAPTWRSDVHNVLAASNDCVADIRLRSKSGLYVGRQPWNRGKRYLVNEPISHNPERFLLPAGSRGTGVTGVRRFIARWPEYAGFPAGTAASLLNIQQLEPAPLDMTSLAIKK